MFWCLHPQDAQEAGATSSPVAKPKVPPVRKTKPDATNERTTRGPLGDTAQPRKRQKTATKVESESGDSALSSLDEAFDEDATKDNSSTRTKKPPGRLSKEKKTVSALKSRKNGRPVEMPSASEGKEDAASVASETNGELHNAGSESEMSEVLDKAPPPKKRGSKASETSKKDKKSAKSKPKEDSNIDPQEAVIKRLQSWLLKCGIRKLWHKELARYDSPKAKINHLRSMLKDAGMDGRYSVEKAKQIKEERELKAELEAVQEGAKQWGEPAVIEDAVIEDDAKRPKRRLAKGLRELDFLGDNDGEETD